MKENQFFISCPDLELLYLYNLNSSDKRSAPVSFRALCIQSPAACVLILSARSIFVWSTLTLLRRIFSREMRGKITILNSILASQRWKKLMMHSKNVTICRLSNLAFIQTGIQTTIRFLFGSVDRSINIFMNNFIYFMPLYWSPSLVGLINDDVRNYDLVDCIVNRLHTKYG